MPRCLARSLATALAGLAVSFSSQAAGPAAKFDPEEVKAKLTGVTWVEAGSKENVTEGVARWKGPKDLGFKYKLEAQGGVLYVWAQVTDDVRVPSGAKPLANDHVEVWLADPSLAAHLQQREDSVQETVDVFQARLTDKECSEREEGFLQDQQALLDTLKKDPRCTHLWFEEGAKNPAGAKPPGAVAPAEYVYVPRDGGYDFFMRLPLAWAFDIEVSPVSRLSFLVDVVDVDDPKATEPKALASSSPGRRFNDPSTFQGMEVAPPWDAGLPKCYASLLERPREGSRAPAGFWRAQGGAYVPQAWAEVEWAGCDASDRGIFPGGAEDLPEGIPAPGGSLKVLLFDRSFLFRDASSCTVWDSGDLIHSAGGREWKLLFYRAVGKSAYLVLDAGGYSRWPTGGETCGEGRESDLLWLELGPGLTVRQANGVLYESCAEGVGSQGLLVDADNVSVRYASKSAAGQGTQETLFDAKDPASGLVTRTASSPEK